jgi:hypothetical protein
MADCPNCSFDVPDGERICPNCGFDTGEGQAERVRELREEGTIHPGRLGAEDRDDFSGGEVSERAPEHKELPAEDTPLGNPEQIDSGL